MLARMRKSMDDRDQGFTLIELLVVMIIIGILAAIAIPVFLNQRKKAVDTAAKSDISTLGKEIATYYVDATTAVAPTVALNGAAVNHYLVNGVDAGKQSSGLGTPLFSFTGTAPTTAIGASQQWCVSLPVTNGTLTNVYYSAANGLSTTSC